MSIHLTIRKEIENLAGGVKLPNGIALSNLYNFAIVLSAHCVVYFIPVRIIKELPLRDFWVRHADAEKPLRLWIHDCKAAQWKSVAEVKAYARSADYVGNQRWVFNVGGNKYRLVVALCFKTGYALVKFVGTHAEYDRIDVATVELGGAV